jgi:hypothetical protein
MWRSVALPLVLWCLFRALPCCAEEQPFLVTYTSYLEERGNLEINFRGLAGSPSRANVFGSTLLEFEYGATKWWTSEFYLEGQSTANESTIFTGYRFENRFKLLPENHWINPVLYTEYEGLNEADKSLKEVTGHDTVEAFRVPNDVARRAPRREWENKLILASYFKGWTLAENLIFDKNVNGGPWEFGYAAGISRVLSQKPGQCKFCARNVQVGVEAYGGCLRCGCTTHRTIWRQSWLCPSGKPQYGFHPPSG